MPWNDKNGGGGPWGGGGNNQGPWGQGPKGPGGPQGSPPDLEDIIRRGQDRLRQALPGGGGPSPALFGLIALILVAFWVYKAVYTVQPDEVAVELRFGKPKQELSEPGLDEAQVDEFEHHGIEHEAPEVLNPTSWLRREPLLSELLAA